MKVLDVNIENLSWEFPSESVLVKYSAYTAPKDIFQALCDEIGKFYQPYGFKYARSRPKITYKTKELTIKVLFWSSHSNMAGSYVNLEILGWVYAPNLAQEDKVQGNTYKGFLAGYTDFSEKLNLHKPKGKITNYALDGTITLERTENIDFGIDIYNNRYNIYGISIENFKNILKYINNIILKQADSLTDKVKIMDYIASLPPNCTLGRENERFVKYIELTFGYDKDLFDLLREKKIIKDFPSPTSY